MERTTKEVDEGYEGMNVATTIRIKKGTKHILDSFKVIQRETYDSVIARIVQNFVEEHLEMNKATEELLDSRIQKLHEGKVMTLNDLLQRVREKRGKENGVP